MKRYWIATVDHNLINYVFQSLFTFKVIVALELYISKKTPGNNGIYEVTKER